LRVFLVFFKKIQKYYNSIVDNSSSQPAKSAGFLVIFEEIVL